MRGTIAITDKGWYERLRVIPQLEEANFWKPSAARAFRAAEFSPFFFKLHAPDNAICGFAYFARYSALPDWLAWQAFGVTNGVNSFEELRDRIKRIRDRILFKGDPNTAEIGCILVVQPTFFSPDDWVAPPADWPAPTQSYKHYDLTAGEGKRVWETCLDRVRLGGLNNIEGLRVAEAPAAPADRFGAPQVVRPRLGQGTFRVVVTDAYERACAITGEHSLPALEAAHIKPYAQDGPHLVQNGLLLRADFHRLFEIGYLTISPDLKLEVGQRLKHDFENGKSYYPFHGQPIRLPTTPGHQPSHDFLAWHRENRFIG